nr:DUF4930 family protein [Staphylococcus aureus]
MRLIFSMIKNIIAVIAIVIIVYIALKYAPFLKEQDWNPVNHDNDQMNQVTQPTNDAQHVYVSGEKYSLKEQSLKHMSKAFNKLKMYTKVKKNLIGFLRSTEVTVNKNDGSYNQHMHVLLFINLEMSQCVFTILNLKCNKT